MRTLLSALLFAAVAAAQSFDGLLPDSTVFYVSVENVARTKERWEKSPLAALWKHEAMKAFLEKPSAKWTEWMEKMRKEEVFAPDDVLGILSGQAIVAGLWPEGAKEPVPLVLVDIGENGEKLHELVAKIEKKVVEEKGNRRDEEEFRGVKIVSYVKAGEGTTEEDGAWFLDGKTFAMAESRETLKDVLARKEHGEEGTLASRELYQRTRGRLGARSGDFFLYVDAPNLLKGLQDSGEVGEQEMHILGAIGVAAIEALGLEFAIEPSGLVTRMFLGVKGGKTGVLKLVDGRNSALMPPRYAPADALTGGAWTLDLAEIWEEARKVADRIQPGMSGQLDAGVAMLKAQTGVDVPAEVIASLGTEIAFHTLAPAEPAGGEPSDTDTVSLSMGLQGRFAVSMQLKDRERFEAALDKLLGALAPGMATQDYLGVKLRTMPTPMGMQPAFAVLPDRFLFAASVDDAKDVIARYGKEAKGLLDREDVTKALALLPGQRFMVSMDDVPKSLAAASSSLGTAMSLFAMSGEGNDFTEAIDFSLFPSAEVLAKYVGMNVSSLVNEEDGLSYLSVLQLVAAE